jgi:hypothetical protein
LAASGGERGASKRPYRALGALLAALAVSVPLDAQTDLFAEDAPLEISLAFDIDSLCRAGADVGCPDTQGTLTYTAAGTDRAVPVWIRARGRWRNVATNCSMPPLSVIFGDGAADGTLFAGQTMLPLTTHCNEHPEGQQQYVLKELLAYHIYNALTEKSMRVRLAHVTYQHTGRRPRSFERYAFFTEHFDSLAARSSSSFWPTENFDVRTGDPAQLATVDLFEFMIGNTDWSIIRGHNVAHLRAPDASVVVVPYDFDFSGIVNASYATPPPSLRIRRVTQRVYRGFCYPGLDWQALFQRFQAAHSSIDAVIEQLPQLEPRHRAEMRAYIASFYDVIGSEQQRQDDIVEECRPLADRS